MMHRFTALAMAAVAAPALAQPSFVVDNFNTDGFTSTSPGAFSRVSAADFSPDILGGFRNVDVDVLSNPGQLPISVVSGLPIGLGDTGAFVVSNPALAVSTVELNYDGDGAGLGINAGSADFLSVGISFITVDLPTSVAITLTDGGGTEVTSSVSLNAGANQAAIAGFTDFAAAGFDTTAIDGISVLINGTSQTADLDLVLDDILFTIPSPAAAAIFAPAAIAATRRRRA